MKNELVSRLQDAHEASVQRALGSDIFKQAADRITQLEIALKRIESWSEHDLQLSVNRGSNGVRDYYRSIADKALNDL